MPYYGPSYYSGEWRRLVEYKPSMSAYGLNSNMYTHRLQLESGKEMNKCHLLYIDGCAYTHKNIVGFINSSRGRDPNVRPNCQFVEVINDRDYPIMQLSISDEYVRRKQCKEQLVKEKDALWLKVECAIKNGTTSVLYAK